MKKENLILFGILALIIAGLGGGVALMHTRGFRNNNPGNLKAGPAWRGVVGVDRAGFAIFDTMENGVRALGKDLTAKMGRGLDTVREIINVYAPPSENPTSSYVAKVSEWLGVSPDAPLTSRDLPDLISAIIRFENGKTLDARVINAGVATMYA